MDQEKDVLTVTQVADYLKLHPLTVRRLAREGQIPAFKVGRQWRVNRDTFDKWMETQSLQNLESAPQT